MAHHRLGWNNWNLRLAMMTSAKKRTCEVCGRNGALGRSHEYGTHEERDCRWCGATRIVSETEVRWVAKRE